MKERPILMSAPMVRAILDGEKTQTRRIVKWPTERSIYNGKMYPAAAENCRVLDGRPIYMCGPDATAFRSVYCQHGFVGDRLWVKETFTATRDRQTIIYRADPLYADMPKCDLGRDWDWTPSIHMPRWASRILLEVTGVRVERLQDISEADCWAEGVEEVMNDFDDIAHIEMANRLGCCIEDAKPLYAQLWESINGPGSWDANPWVWVVEFRRVVKATA